MQPNACKTLFAPAFSLKIDVHVCKWGGDQANASFCSTTIG